MELYVEPKEGGFVDKGETKMENEEETLVGREGLGCWL